MATSKKSVKKKLPVEPKKVLINYKVSPAVKNLLKAKANHYTRGNVTKLIRLFAKGHFKAISNKKAA